MAKHSIWQRLKTKGALFPPELAFTLLIPLRNIFLSPKKLVERLDLSADQTVLEVGPGPGYFSPHVAKAIPGGKLVLADVQPEMLALAEKRLAKRGIGNVEYQLCSGKEFPFPDQTFDRIFLVTVLGEVAEKELYAQEFWRLLKPGGLLSISEQGGDADQMTKEAIQELFCQVGFQLAATYGGKRNFTLNFLKNLQGN